MRRPLAIVALLLACGPPPKATFTRVEKEVFTSCTFNACHVGAGAEGLNLEKPSYAKVVGAPTHGFDGGTLVVPGKPDESYLYEKISKATPRVGVQMPNTGDPLEPARIQLVKDWITAGAEND